MTEPTEIFELKNVIEGSWPSKKLDWVARIEICESIQRENIFRSRIFVKSVYMLYPTFINQDLRERKNDLIYSDEAVFTDLTGIIVDDPEWITGFRASNLEAFRASVIQKVSAFFEVLETD